jgi:DNA-binding IclR family transcriptional regulator
MPRAKSSVPEALPSEAGDDSLEEGGQQTGGAQSIRRALRILRILAAGQDQGVRLTDIVRDSGLSRPSVHRILRVLIEEMAVEQDPNSRRYMVGPEVSLLGLARTARFPIRAIADPYLRHISEQVGDTVYLTIRSGVDSICVDRKLGTYPVKVMSIEVGVRRPLGVGVGGIALMALLPEEEARQLIKINQQRLAHLGITSARLNEWLKTTRTKGYAYRAAGVMPGTSAVAVAVPGPQGEPVAAISVAAISMRLTQQRLPEVIGLMREQAALISQRLMETKRRGR